MQVNIEKNAKGSGCKVVIDGHPVSFATVAEAEAYVARLQERLQAAPQAFTVRDAEA